MKRIISLLICFCIILPFSVVSAETSLYAERSRYDLSIGYIPIDTWYLNGNRYSGYVSVDDLKYYGYNSVFNADTGLFELTREKFALPEFNYNLYKKMFSERRAEKVIPSSIQVTLNGKSIESICTESALLVKHSDVNYSIWDELEAELEAAENVINKDYIDKDYYTSAVGGQVFEYSGQVNDAGIPHGIGKYVAHSTQYFSKKEYIGYFENGRPIGIFAYYNQTNRLRNYGAVYDWYIYGILEPAEYKNYTTNLLIEAKSLVQFSSDEHQFYNFIDEQDFKGVFYSYNCDSIVKSVPDKKKIVTVTDEVCSELYFTEGIMYSEKKEEFSPQDYSYFKQYINGREFWINESIITESEDENGKVVLNAKPEGGIKTDKDPIAYLYAERLQNDAVLNSVPIDTFYINGKPYVSVDDLKYYGYNFTYNQYTCHFELFRDKNIKWPQNFNYELWKKMFSERRAEKVIASPIKVFVDGHAVPSYCIENTVLVSLDDVQYSFKDENFFRNGIKVKVDFVLPTDSDSHLEYEGQVNEDNVPHGLGKWTDSKSGTSYTGYFADGKPFGLFYYESGMAESDCKQVIMGELCDRNGESFEKDLKIFQFFPSGIYDVYDYNDKVSFKGIAFYYRTENQVTETTITFKPDDKLQTKLTLGYPDGINPANSEFTLYNNFEKVYYDESKITVHTDENGKIILNSAAQGGGVNKVKTPQILLNGKVLTKKGIIVNDRTLVPLRELFEKMGATVEWIEQTSSVVITKDEITVKLQIGNNTMAVNENSTELDVAPQLINDSTYIPARAVSEALGAEVQWNEALKQVVITSAN